MNIHSLYFSLFPQGAIITPRAHGIDVSKYDTDFDPTTTDKQLDFVIQRTSYRLTKDEAFDELLPGVMAVPIRLAYHYYNHGYTGDGTWRDQVNVMLSVIQGLPYHATAWDFEGAYNVLGRQMAVNSYYAIKELEQRTGKLCFLYTSLNLYDTYIYPTIATDGLNWNSVPLWLAQWLFTPDPNKYPSIPKGRESLLGEYWDLWQYTNKGSGYGTFRNYPTDLDVYNGTVDDLRQRLNISAPTNDVITYPFDGVKHIEGVRDGWNFSLDIADRSKVTFEVLHGNKVEYPSNFSENSTKPNIFTNGGEWSYETSMPEDLSVSNGVTYVPRTIGRPSLMFLEDGSIVIDTVNHPNIKHAITGVWYIVQNGVPAFVDGTDARRTEGHSRTCFGLDAAGNVMVMVSDGLYPNQGLKLRRAAEIMTQYGCVTAFDGGGGGDSTRGMDGVVTNEPQDGAEKAVPETVLIYAGGAMATVKHWTAKTIELTKVRDAPAGNELAYKIPSGTNIEADLENGNWLHVIIPSQYVGWVNKSSLTNILEKLVVVDEPPPTPAPSPVTVTDIIIDAAPGTVVTIRKSDGTQVVIP